MAKINDLKITQKEKKKEKYENIRVPLFQNNYTSKKQI